MNIVPTASLAPNGLVLGFELHEADGAGALYRLAFAIMVVVRGTVLLKHAHQGAFVHLSQLLHRETYQKG